MTQPGTRFEAMLVTKYQSGGEEKSSWVRIGAAFVNRDGSISVKLDAFPAAGSDLVLQIPLSREAREAKFGTHGQAMRLQSQPQRGGYEERGQGQGYRPPTGRGQGQRTSSRQVGNAPPREEQDPGIGDAGYSGPTQPWIIDGLEVWEARDLPVDHPDHIPF